MFSHDKYTVQYVIMEWTYRAINSNGKSRDYGNPCPNEKVQEMAKMLDASGYTPHDLNGRPSDYRKALSFFGDIMWIHKDAKSLFHRSG